MTLTVTGSTPTYYADSGAPAASYVSSGMTIRQGQFYLDSTTGNLYICTNNSNQSALVWEMITNQTNISSYQTQADWNQASSANAAYINNKPTIPSAQVNSDWNSVSGVSQILNKPSIPAAQINSDWNSVTGLSQILNKPSIPAAQVNSDWNAVSGIAQILNKPTINAASQSSASGRSLNTVFQLSATQNTMVNYSINISCTISLTVGQTGTVSLQIASNSGFTTNVQTLTQFVNGNTGTLTLGLNLVQGLTGTVSGFVPAGYYCRLLTANTSGTPTFTYVMGQETLL